MSDKDIWKQKVLECYFACYQGISIIYVEHLIKLWLLFWQNSTQFEKRKAVERVNPQNLQKADSGKAITSGSWGDQFKCQSKV